MDLSHIDIVEAVFQFIAFLFAISVHESAHAWTANRCGDPMLSFFDWILTRI